MSKKKFENVETVIGANSTVRGDVEVAGALRVDGRLFGNTSADWITVGEKGVVNGDIKAKGVVVAGAVEGTIAATERIEIAAKGRVKGDLCAPRLVIEEGGALDGRSFMQGEIPVEPEAVPSGEKEDLEGAEE